MTYLVTFAVQSFYCHRIWIITGKKKVVTIPILALGIWTTFDIIKHGTIKFLDTTSLVPIASGVSAVCDTIITGTIFKCLWKSELRGRSHVIRDLVVVCVNMGALTCLISVIYLGQGNAYWVSAPAVILSRCYVNSLLAMLNARRQIRERQLHGTLRVPTLSMMQ
ncbi:hypothetical protein OG21DRAFT_393198 [Imleria badia]|nr:hypothetical protein OG21DRAFT_393198 [Imleria badia]